MKPAFVQENDLGKILVPGFLHFGTFRAHFNYNQQLKFKHLLSRLAELIRIEQFLKLLQVFRCFLVDHLGLRLLICRKDHTLLHNCTHVIFGFLLRFLVSFLFLYELTDPCYALFIKLGIIDSFKKILTKLGCQKNVEFFVIEQLKHSKLSYFCDWVPFWPSPDHPWCIQINHAKVLILFSFDIRLNVSDVGSQRLGFLLSSY